jgi:hypothetical protein
MTLYYVWRWHGSGSGIKGQLTETEFRELLTLLTRMHPAARADLERRLQVGWRNDCWDEDDPVGYPTEAEAQARALELMAGYRKRYGREMYPPPVVRADRPRMRPKPKEQRHYFTPAELNGQTLRREAIPESHQLR